VAKRTIAVAAASDRRGRPTLVLTGHGARFRIDGQERLIEQILPALHCTLATSRRQSAIGSSGDVWRRADD
jgi:hypothetical protein